MGLQTLTVEALESELNSGTVLIQFSAPWCAPCRAAEPHVLAGAEKLVDVARVRKVDLGQPEHAKTAQRFSITSLPTFILFKDGQEVARHTGTLRSADAVVELGSRI